MVELNLRESRMEEAFGLEACAGRTVLGFMWFPFGLAGSGFEFEFGVFGLHFPLFCGSGA